MKNELFSIGPFTIYGYGLMIAIGIIAAYLTGEYRAKKNQLDADRVFSIVIWSVVGGLLGAKVLYFITQIKEIMNNPRLLLDVTDGFVVYGGIIGGILSAMLYCKVKKLPFLKYFDLLMPSVALAQGFGRIGCFLAGCCYGKETTSHLSVVFPAGGLAPVGVHLHPTQLYSAAFDVLLALFLLWLSKKNKKSGVIFSMYLILYSIGRFIVEYFRGDPRGNVSMLSTSQFIAIFILVLGISVLVLQLRKGRKSKSE